MKERIFAFLGYLFGGLFGLLGIVSLFGDPIPAIPLLIIAGLLLPPSSQWLQSKIGYSISGKTKAAAVFGLFVLFGIAAGYEEERDSAREAEQVLREKMESQRDRFAESRDSILDSMKSFIANEEFQEALRITASFEFVDDSTLKTLEEQAEAGKAEQVARRRERELTELVRTIPARETKRNMDVYRELTQLDPENQYYREKYDHYRTVYQREQERKRQRQAFLGGKPVASAWDGTYREVKDYLKAVARDPESVEVEECTRVYEVDEGWLVGCNWRARNGFGGMNREANWFIIRQGRVTEMKPRNAYKVD